MPSLRTIEAKLDALLEKACIKPEDVVKAPPAPKPRELTAAEQQAIANAPKPTPIAGPRNARTTATNAPDVSSSTPPAEDKTDAKKDDTKTSASKRKD